MKEDHVRETLYFWIVSVFAASVQVHFGLSIILPHQMGGDMQLVTWDCEVALLSRIVISGPPQSYQYHTQPAPSNLKPKRHPEAKYIKANAE